MSRRRILSITLVALVALLHLPVVFAPETYLYTWFNTDDAFYYFVTARNIAAGNGVSFDGLQPGNGFHPLWMLLVTPIFAIDDLVLPLRLVTVLLVALNVGTALLMFRLGRRHLSEPIAFLMALAFSLLPGIHDVITRAGMESGQSAFTIALVLYRLDRTDAANPRSILLLSLAGVLAFLARLDNIFLAGFAGLYLLLANWHSSPNNAAPWLQRLKLCAYSFLPLLLVLGTFMIWNQVGFDTATPVSGQVKRWWGTLDNSIYGFPPKRLVNFVGQFVTDDVNIGPWSLITRPYYAGAEWLGAQLLGEATTASRRVGLAILGGVSVITLSFAGWRQRRFFWDATRGLGLLPLLAGCLLQILYYKAGGSVGERPWYWVSEMMAIVLVGGLVLEGVRREEGKEGKREGERKREGEGNRKRERGRKSRRQERELGNSGGGDWPGFGGRVGVAACAAHPAHLQPT